MDFSRKCALERRALSWCKTTLPVKALQILFCLGKHFTYHVPRIQNHIFAICLENKFCRKNNFQIFFVPSLNYKIILNFKCAPEEHPSGTVGNLLLGNIESRAKLTPWERSKRFIHFWNRAYIT